MRRFFTTTALLLGLAAFGAVDQSVSANPFEQSAEIRLKDGTRWRGEVSDVITLTFIDGSVEIRMVGELKKVSDLYIIVEGKMAGTMRQKTIFRDDIVSIRTSSDEDEDTGSSAGDRTPTKAKSKSQRGSSRKASGKKDVPRDELGNPLGVFVLPLEGGVGQTLRHNEIDMMREHLDKNYGPGQIVILKIRSNGGLVSEAEIINESIARMRQDHRVIAWIDKALSAGCSTAMSCDEIYFETNGAAGSVTTMMGNVSVSEADARKGIEQLVSLAESNGSSEHIARAMKLNKFMCSYDKDPVTGEVTFYGDLSGEHILSTAEQNLCFNAITAKDCGFSKGTADTNEDMAKLLDLPEWHEIDDYGHKIAKKWQKTYKSVNDDLRRIQARLGYYKTGSGDPVEILGGQIQLYKQMLRCYDRADFVTMMALRTERETIEREIANLRKDLADLKRAQRNP